jgi:hypothetical protein
MTDPRSSSRPPGGPSAAVRETAVPLGQRLFDNVFFWLVAGLLIMAVVYTGWGLVEILTLPPATLP